MTTLPTWEYRLIALDAKGWFVAGILDFQALTNHLNALGKDGWELVSVFDTTNQAHTRQVVAALKRPRL